MLPDQLPVLNLHHNRAMHLRYRVKKYFNKFSGHPSWRLIFWVSRLKIGFDDSFLNEREISAGRYPSFEIQILSKFSTCLKGLVLSRVRPTKRGPNWNIFWGTMYFFWMISLFFGAAFRTRRSKITAGSIEIFGKAQSPFFSSKI